MYGLLSIAIISVLLFSISHVFAQEITFGKKPEQKIEIRIDEKGIAHVLHSVVGSKSAQQIETFAGALSNLSVKDKDGNDIDYLTVEKQPLGILLPPSNKDVVFVKYDLSDVLSLKNGIWTWEYSNPELANFYFPKGVDIIWVNDRPVFLGDKGIRHHGGDMKLEYVADEPMILKEAEWEGKKFTVGIRTLTDLGEFQFNQPTKSITFDVAGGNPLITAIIPRNLLWEPYDVYINQNKTLNSEFYNNGTHVWLGFRPDTSGTIKIVGTTVVPEFPVFVPLVIGISIVLALQFRNKFNFR